MDESLPNLSELSIQDKDDLIVRLFAAVENLQARVTLLESENQALRAENQELWLIAKKAQHCCSPKLLILLLPSHNEREELLNFGDACACS